MRAACPLRCFTANADERLRSSACTELDLGYESCNVDGGCSLRTGTGFYDGYLVKTGWLAEFVSAEVLKPLNDYLRESTAFAWNDVMPPVRRYLSTFDGNVVMTPVDADFGTLLVRRDLEAQYEAEVGRRPNLADWDGLAEFAHHWDGKDLNGDGVADFGPCNSRCNAEGWGYMALGGPLSIVYASIVQTQGTAQGIYFNTSTMEPNFPTNALGLAIEKYTNVSRACPVGGRFADVEAWGSLMRAGRCAFAFAHPGPANGVLLSGVRRSNASGHVLWEPSGGASAAIRRLQTPGSRTVLSQGVLVRSSTQNSPFAACLSDNDCVNRAPLLSGGNAMIIRNQSDARKMRQLFEFYSFLNAPSQSTDDTATRGVRLCDPSPRT